MCASPNPLVNSCSSSPRCVHCAFLNRKGADVRSRDRHLPISPTLPPPGVLSLAMPFLATMAVSSSTLPPQAATVLGSQIAPVPEGATQEAHEADPKVVSCSCVLSEHSSLTPPTSTPWVEHPRSRGIAWLDCTQHTGVCPAEETACCDLPGGQ